jgi:predicted esterase
MLEVKGDVVDGNSKIPIVIFLPAMDEDNMDREDLFSDLVNDNVATFVLPLAAKRFVATRVKKVRAWYDFTGYVRTPKNLIGYGESFTFISDVVRACLDTGRPVYLSGHGQGGSLALDVALSIRAHLPRPVDGVLVFAGYVITHEAQDGGYSDLALRQTRVLWAHSQRDQKVPWRGAKYGFDEYLVKKSRLQNGRFLRFETPKSRKHEFGERAAQLLRDFVQEKPIREAREGDQ